MSKLVKVLLVLTLMIGVIAVMPVNAQDDDLTIVVGTNAEYPPFESVDEDDNIIGFDIDLMNAIAEDAGITVEYVNTRWDGIFVALGEGEFDAVISAATITEEREEIIDFTDPYFNAGQAIAVTADLADSVSTPEDLVGLRVGVQLGTTGDEFASEIDGVEVVRFDEITLAFQALGEGEVDAILNDGPTSADIIANNPDLNAVIVGDPLTTEYYGIAVNPERSDVLDILNVALENVIADGTYAEIFEEWFGQAPPSEFMPMDDMADEDMDMDDEDMDDMDDEDMAEDDMDEMMIDFTDPESVAIGLVATFFQAETPEDLLAFACEGAGESPLIPDQATLDGFAGITANLDAFEVIITENEDGSISATPEGEITLVIGESEQTLPASLLGAQLGIESIRFTQNDDGEWELCPGE